MQNHILVQQTHDNDIKKLKIDKTIKHSASVVSNNIGSQTLTDQVLTTIIRKQTESGGSEVDPTYTHQHMNTEETVSNNNSTLSHFNYFMTKKDTNLL